MAVLLLRDTSSVSFLFVLVWEAMEKGWAEVQLMAYFLAPSVKSSGSLKE